MRGPLAVDRSAGAARRAGAATAGPGIAARSGGTTILVLRVGAARVELVAWSDKAFRFVPEPCDPSPSALLWRIEDARTGRLLREGLAELPPLCACDRGRDHASGCVLRRHEAIVRVKLPRLAPVERVRLLTPDGATELDAFELLERA